MAVGLNLRKKKKNYSSKVSCLRYFPHMTETQQFITH